jgi:hypothetical protein
MKLFIVLSFGILILARYWKRKIDAAMLPQSITGKVMESNFYQLYFVTAMKQQWSAMLLFFNVFPLIFMSVTFFYFINPVIELDEMTKYHGVIVGIHKATIGSAGNDYLWIEAEEGTIKFINSLGKGDFEYLKQVMKTKDKITVWTQMKWSLPPAIHSERVWQILHGDKYITKYNKERVERYRTLWQVIFYSSFIWIIFTMIIIKKKCQNYDQES